MKTWRWTKLFLLILMAIVPLFLSSCGERGKSASSSSSPTTYIIGGTVTGLSGSGLVMQDNGSSNLAISVNGSFAFATAIARGGTYSVTVMTQPASPVQFCKVSNGRGTASANVTNVQVTCTRHHLHHWRHRL